MVMTAGERFWIATDVSLARPVIDLALNAMSLPGCGGDLRVTRVFPSGNGLCIQYGANVSDGDRQARVLLCGFLPANDDAPEWASRDAVFRMPGSGLVVPAFPYDPALPALKGLVENRALVIEWLERCGVSTSRARFETTVLAYRLQRRCVLRHTVRSDDGAAYRVVSKVMRRSRVADAAERWRALAETTTEARVRLPRLLAVDEERGILGIEFVGGRSLHDCVGDHAFPDACAESARLLAALHCHDPRHFARYGAADEIASLDRFGALMEGFQPHAAAAVAERIERLRRRAPSGARTTTVHRDFYDKQIILSRDGAAMLDWDGVSSGDPATDVGNFVAHLNLRALQHAASRGLLDAGARRFQAMMDGDNERVEWWRAASLTRLAVLYRWRPRWKHLFGAILSEADMAMKSGGIR